MRTGGSLSRSPNGNGTTRTQRPLARSTPPRPVCSIGNRVVATVFAGADVEATDRARSYFTGRAASSPSIALLQQGKLVYMLERGNIENRNAQEIAEELTAAFAKYCATPTLS